MDKLGKFTSEFESVKTNLLELNKDSDFERFSQLCYGDKVIPFHWE